MPKQLALIDKETLRVINKCVTPEGHNVWMYDDTKLIVVESDAAKIGQIYDPATETFNDDPEVVAAREAEIARAAEARTAKDDRKDALLLKQGKIQAAIDALKKKESLTIEEEGTLAGLEDSLESVQSKLALEG